MGRSCPSAQDAIERLRAFCWTEPRLPDAAHKTFVRHQTPLDLQAGMDRSQVISRASRASGRPTSSPSLAFYAYRDLNRTEVEPFLKAAMERCPVSIAGAADLDEDALIQKVQSFVRGVHLRRDRPAGAT